ncbi:MAG: acyltransferase [Actinomycetota bacterium]
MTFLGDIKNRILGLDILRAVAILLVIYGHGALFVPQKFIPYYKLPFPAIDGVSIFFVLSGYLIGKILFKIIQNSELKPKDLLNFWIRRWFRTLPNYFLILGILLAIPLLKSGIIAHDFNWKYLLFLQNFSGPHPNFFPEAWSLCIEEWFYLLFPIACCQNRYS